MAVYLVHFKSRDLSRLLSQDHFWRIFFTSGSVIISQDEADTWTVHTPIAVDVDSTSVDPIRTVYQALGGSWKPFEIHMDEDSSHELLEAQYCHRGSLPDTMG